MDAVRAAVGKASPSVLAEALVSLASSPACGADVVLEALREVQGVLPTPPPPVSKKRKRGGADAGAGAREAAMGGVSITAKGGAKKELDFGSYRTRHMAFHIMYLGHDYCGLAINTVEGATIEYHVFQALVTARLVPTGVHLAKGMQYSRAGRTDKGVSALGQVLSLMVRSRARVKGAVKGKTVLEEDEPLPPLDAEMDYVSILNRLLPKDIVVVGMKDVAADFRARFSATHRCYRYFFPRRQLNIAAMNEAAGHLVGRHDFQNFCKIDIMSVANFERVMLESGVRTVDGGDAHRHQMCVFEIKGHAFLWHQVRCMVAVLFMVGMGKEEPDIVRRMLDTETFVGKPAYELAPPGPLLLYETGYVDLEFVRSQGAMVHAMNGLERLWSSFAIKAAQIDACMSFLRATTVTPPRGVPPTPMAAWLDSRTADSGIVEYPIRGVHTAMEHRPRSESAAARLAALTDVQRKARTDAHPGFHPDRLGYLAAAGAGAAAAGDDDDDATL